MLRAPLDTIVFTVFLHSVLCRVTCTVDQAYVFLVFVHTVSYSVTCSVGHNGVFPDLCTLFYPVLHAPLDTLAFSVFFWVNMFYVVLHAPLGTLVFSVFFFS